MGVIIHIIYYRLRKPFPNVSEKQIIWLLNHNICKIGYEEFHNDFRTTVAIFRAATASKNGVKSTTTSATYF